MKLLRAHVVGSMLRPKALLDQLPQYRAGAIDACNFKRVEDAAVDEAIRIQEDAGIDLVTDGEQRRLAFGDVVAQGVRGIERSDFSAEASGMWNGEESLKRQALNSPTGGTIVGKLERGDSQVIEEFVYARSRATKPIKVTLPSPTMFAASWSPEKSARAYPTFAHAMEDIVNILQQEIHALAKLGCRHVQFDAPELTFAIDPKSMMLRNQTRESFCAMVVEHLNAVAVEPGVTFSVHFCRGNARGLWHSAGGYEAISKLAFPGLKRFQYVLLEYDTDRAGGFEALGDLPDDCCAVLGLITTKSARLETQQELKARIDDASKYFSRAQLGLSPQCGFASDSGGNPLSMSDQAAKLHLVAQVAHETWH